MDTKSQLKLSKRVKKICSNTGLTEFEILDLLKKLSSKPGHIHEILKAMEDQELKIVNWQ